MAAQENDELVGKAPQAPARNGVAADQRVSHLWAVRLSESLAWAPMFQAPVRHQKHINLFEASAYVALLHRVPRDRRLAIGQDSKVTIGATAHGRSGSPRLNAALAASVPYNLGENLHPTSFHAPPGRIAGGRRREGGLLMSATSRLGPGENGEFGAGDPRSPPIGERLPLRGTGAPAHVATPGAAVLAPAVPAEDEESARRARLLVGVGQ